MRPGVKTEDVIAEVDKEIEELRDKPVGAEELQKAKNLEQASFVFGQDSIFNEAMQLGVYEMLGDYKHDGSLPAVDRQSHRRRCSARRARNTWSRTIARSAC